jgi:hypothetical protein
MSPINIQLPQYLKDEVVKHLTNNKTTKDLFIQDAISHYLLFLDRMNKK